MKHILKKTCLLGLSLLFIFSIVGFIGVTNLANGENGENEVTINTDPTSDLHRPSLYSLFLSGDVSQSWMASLSNNFLSVLNGLIVGNKNNANGSYVFIGGGIGNSVTQNYAGIGGGSGNRVSNHGGAIGGGRGNGVAGDYGVIVGGFNNRANNYGVVVGGQDHNDNNNEGVILGGKENAAGDGSLVLGKKAKGENYSFAWNKEAGNYEAGIKADNGVLIGTYKAKTGVALVVSGAIKLSTELNNPEDIGEMKNNNGCIEVNDGGSLHVLGKTSESKCNAGMGCIFGKTKMQDGDILVGYSESYTEKGCQKVTTKVSCHNGTLSPSNAYPYCYDISPASNPTNPRALPLVP